jgi:hypothetical protein
MFEVTYLGRSVFTRYNGVESVHHFETQQEARTRAAFVAEAVTWVGTPFVNCGDVKGPDGAVDCAMLLVRSAVDPGILPPFDPRPYPPSLLLHSDREDFLEWIRDKLGGVEVDKPKFGDVSVYLWGRIHTHGAIVLGDNLVVHAYQISGFVKFSRRDEDVLLYLPRTRKMPRPVKHFDLWSKQWLPT